MGKIKLLPPLLRNQIAAGECIERPASVVKELLENSLDAESTSIEIEIEQAGKSLIKVKDNGCGIEPEDLQLALTSHATSKIDDIKDLNSIRTYGFRGEALPSIASISKIVIYSAVSNDKEGYKIECENGVLGPIKPVGMSKGTIVEVRNLFFNVPARRKFLKSNSVEMSHITDTVIQIALASYNVSYKLIHNKKVILNYKKASNPLERIKDVLGRDIEFIKVKAKSEHYSFYGYLGLPQYAKTTNKYQFCYINGRYVKDRTMLHALQDAYQSYLLEKQYPVAVLYLEVDPSWIDVNVHPTKIEVRHRNTQEVYNLIYNTIIQNFTNQDLAVKIFLNKNNNIEQPFSDNKIIKEVVKENKKEDKKIVSINNSSFDNQNILNKDSIQTPEINLEEIKKQYNPIKTEKIEQKKEDKGKKLEKKVNYYEALRKNKESKESNFVINEKKEKWNDISFNKVNELFKDDYIPNQNYGEIDKEIYKVLFNEKKEKYSEKEKKFESKTQIIDNKTSYSIPKEDKEDINLNYIQIHDSYIIQEVEDGFIIIDQHALHEKIIYERLKKQIDKGKIITQSLLFPEQIEVSNEQMEIFIQYKEEIEKIGIKTQIKEKNKIEIETLPQILGRVSPSYILISILEELEKKGKIKKESLVIKEIISQIACKSAIKFGDKLNKEEIQSLLKIKDKMENTLSHCPHGRPTVLKITLKELERYFKRC